MVAEMAAFKRLPLGMCVLHCAISPVGWCASASRDGRCEGRKPLSATRPEVVALARKLRRRRPKGGQLSLRGIANELAARGFLNERGKPFLELAYR